MSSVINPTTYEILQNRRYNLWGGEQNVFPRFPATHFDGVTPSVNTNPTLNDLKQIVFDNEQDGQVLSIGLTAGATPATPGVMDGIFAVDGMGNCLTKLLDHTKKLDDGTYPRLLISNSDPMALMATWGETTRNISLERNNLDLADSEYPTHVVLTMIMESPSIGAWLAFSNDGKTFYKVNCNIYSDQTKRYMEGQTICMPLALKDLDWNRSLQIKHRNMGRYVIQLRGVVYRRVTP